MKVPLTVLLHGINVHYRAWSTFQQGLETAIKGCTLWDPWKLHQVADFDLCMYLLSIRDAPTVRQVPIVLRTLSDESLCDFIAIVLLTEPLVGAFVLHRDSINQYKAYQLRLRVFIGK
jgi:hypothetical protein